jgi:hypothetical protein
MQIIHEAEYSQAQSDYSHLFDICQPKAEMLEKKMDWLVRDGFDKVGTLMLGDLIVSKHETKNLETHSFPEWVIQIYQPGQSSGKVYAIVPAWEEKDVRKFETWEWTKRVKKTQELLDNATEDSFLAIEYAIGINIKICANVPHEFISVVGENEINPYCQVFEPNFAKICEVLKMEPTAYYNLKLSLTLSEV